MAEKVSIENNDDSLQKTIGVFGEDWVKGDPIGSGGFGTVYLVKSLRDNSEPKYVVKEILGFENNEHKKTVESFELETAILKKIGYNKRIVPFIGATKCGKSMLIVLGYMKMGSLRKYLESKNGLGEEATMRFTRQILQGLAFLHENKIIHRDVKGDNVLMEDKRHVRLTDFGISKILQDVSSTATCAGTNRWMAPEVVNTGEGNPKYNETADIWSVGCTVIEMMTGHSPYRNIQNSPQVIIQIHKGIIPTLGNIVPSSELKEFLQKTLQLNPEDRPSAEDLLKNANFVNRERFITELKLKAENLEREIKNQEEEIKRLKEQLTYLNSEVKYTLVLVGKTGAGKSASGNTLLGRQVFHEYCGINPETPNVCKGKAIIQEELFEVFDTPGFLITDMSNEEDAVSAVEDATEIIYRSKRGVTAFLVVYRYGVRYFHDNAHSIKMLMDIYGPNVINKYGICLMTCGDLFDLFNDKKPTFNEWCEQQEGKVKDFVCLFNKRIVLMHNIGNKIKRERCRAEVFDIVRQLNQRQDPYTKTDFKKNLAAFHNEQKLKQDISKFHLEVLYITRENQLKLLAKADKLINKKFALNPGIDDEEIFELKKVRKKLEDIIRESSNNRSLFKTLFPF